MNKMKNLLRLSLLIVFISGCAHVTPSVPQQQQPKPRTITLGGTVYNEETSGKFTSWECYGFPFGSEILFEVGIISDTNLEQSGFVLYDGTDSGDVAHYQRKGINHRWDWGPKGNDFSFIIIPDGTGLFYDFSNTGFWKKEKKAEQIFRCQQRQLTQQ